MARPLEGAVVGSDWQYLTNDSEGKWKYFDFGRIRSPIPGENHEAWVEVPLLPAEPQKNTLLFATDGQAVEVFVEGSKIYTDGDFSARFMGHGKKWHMVELPAVPYQTMLLFHFYADSAYSAPGRQQSAPHSHSDSDHYSVLQSEKTILRCRLI